MNTKRLLTPLLAVLTATAAIAQDSGTIMPGAEMTIQISGSTSVDPRPDTLILYLGDTVAGEPGIGERRTVLDLLGASEVWHEIDINGAVVGPLTLDPAGVFRTEDSVFRLLDPAIADFSSLWDGLGTATIELDIQTGTLEVDPDQVRVEWGVATGPDTFEASAIQPEITSIRFTPCRADYDDNGILEIFDLLIFLNYYEALDLRADFDKDGVVTIVDAVRMINAIGGGRCR